MGKTTLCLLFLLTLQAALCRESPVDLVDLRHHGLTYVPSNIPANSRRVHLQQNNIRYIRKGELSHLSLCIELNLAYNSLREVRPDMLEGMYSLEELDLSYNQITMVLPGSFSQLMDLEVLSLAGNQLKTFEENVFETNRNQIRHPSELELALDGNPLECDRRMCWIQEAEKEGWVRFIYKYDWVPQCLNHQGVPWAQIRLC